MQIVALYFAIGFFIGCYEFAYCWKQRLDTAACIAGFIVTWVAWPFFGWIFLCDRISELCTWVDKRRGL